ncbi:MAG: hypothetical protein IID61_16055 [SAR324 cluster bacterium]|nr:hypothetical protein [SAR324 cluster bacterium]
MAEQASPPIRIRYVKDDGYRLIPANGAFGGPTPKGDVIIHFFVDHSEMPDVTELAQQEDQPPGTLQEIQPQNLGVRRAMQMGVVLNAQVARSIGHWLLAKSETILGPERVPPNA